MAYPDAHVLGWMLCRVSFYFVIVGAESFVFAHECIEPMLERCCAHIFLFSFCFWHNSNGLVRSRLFFLPRFCAPTSTVNTRYEMQLHRFFPVLLFIPLFSTLYKNGLYAPKTLCLVFSSFFSLLVWCNLTILWRCVRVCVCVSCYRQKFMFSFRCLANSLCRFHIFHFHYTDVCVRVQNAAQCIV